MGSSLSSVSKIFRKTIISCLLIRTRTCAYQGVKNVSFPENFAYALNESSLSKTESNESINDGILQNVKRFSAVLPFSKYFHFPKQMISLYGQNFMIRNCNVLQKVTIEIAEE